MLGLKFHTLLLSAHLMALALGFGVAVAADILVLSKAVTQKISQTTIDTVEYLATVVAAGLAMLWGSGLALLIEISAEKPEFLSNEKFWAKVVIVVILTANGYAIHTHVLPRLKARVGRRLLDDLPNRERMLLVCTAAVSTLSWTFPMVLGCARELSYVTPVIDILAVYVLVLAIAIAAGFKLVSQFPPAIPDRREAVPASGRKGPTNRQKRRSRPVPQPKMRQNL